MHERLSMLIREHGLSDHAPLICTLARTCIRIDRRPIAQEALRRGPSRLGGRPDLRPGHVWPTGQVYPMALIAQIDLSEASAADSTGLLPRRGRLCFWYDVAWQPWGFDPRDNDGFRVDYVTEEVPLLQPRDCPPAPEMAAAPDYDRPKSGCYPASAVDFRPGVSLPNWEWIEEFAPHASAVSKLDAYAELESSLRGGEEPEHQMLGHANLIQAPMESECQFASNGILCSGHYLHGPRVNALRAGAPDRRLLLQVDTDQDGPGWMWGDVGMIYYWIREQDLRRADFSRVWVVLQC